MYSKVLKYVPFSLLEELFQAKSQGAAFDILLKYVHTELPPSIQARIFIPDDDKKVLSIYSESAKVHPDDPRAVPIGPEATTSGRAAHFREDICTFSIKDDPRWSPHEKQAQIHDMKACWAFPLLMSQGGDLLGILTFYFNHELTSRPQECSEFFNAIGRLASLVVERFTNLEKQNRLLESLRTSQNRLELALRARKMGVWEVDLQTGATVWDRQMHEIYGISEEEFGGTVEWWTSLIHPDDLPQVIEEYTRSSKSRELYSNQFRIFSCHGLRYIKSSAVYLYDESGNVIGMTGVNWDRTDFVLKSQKAEQARAKSIASSKMASLGEMASGIAHEINNPLTIILNRASHIKASFSRGTFTVDWAMSELDKIEGTVERIAKIIRGLRAFSRNGDNDPFIPTSLDTIIADTLELCREKFKNNNVDLVVKSVPDILLPCRQSQIAQVLLNLLCNGFDAVQGLKNAWVEIEAQALEDRIRITVTDNGPGISRIIADKIMEPFFTTKAVGKGTGLGLSIAKGIVEDHQGVLYLDSSHPNTCFVIELPTDLPIDLGDQSDSNHDVVF